MSAIQLSEKDRIRAALEYIPSDDRDQWVRMGMAVKSELGDSGFDIWDEWSRRSDKYDERDARLTWKSIDAAGGIAIGTLFYEARARGYEDGASYKPLEPQECARRDAERQAQQKRHAAEDAARHAAAAKRATHMWESAAPAVEHAYLSAKDIGPNGARIGRFVERDEETGELITHDDALLIQVRDFEKNTHSLQAIFVVGHGEDGRPQFRKKYLAGGEIASHFCPLGQPKVIDGRKIFVVVEGFATGASVREATGHCIVVAFDAGNLDPVCREIRKRFGDADIVIFSDRDAEALDESTGTRRALEAALAINARLVVPEWMGRKGYDANDIAIDGFAWGGATYPGKDTIEGCVRFATPPRSPAFMEMLRECGITGSDLQSVESAAADAAVRVIEPASTVRPPAVSDAAREIGDAIAWRLSKALDADEHDERLGIDLAAIDRMIGGSFWSGGKSKLFMLNEAQTLNQFVAGDAYRFLTRACGSPLDAKAVAEMTEQYISANNLDKAAEKDARRATAAAAESVIVDHLKYHNQREKVEWRCDMFARNAHMHLREDTARVVLMHKPFEVRGGYEQAIIDDYKQHFTRFDEFLKFLVQSRFALDRKKCYLWILADSDWGKGFLLGVLKELRLTVETSMAEIEAMLEGKPVGRSPEEFKRAFAIVVDEFKVVKSELKSLQSEISLSPKNQLSSSVEVFAKIFLSAESVASLVTENGVEDQFANRMSIFAERGTLESRPLYEEVGNPRYFESVLNYTAVSLNRLVEEMQALGRAGSQDHAQRWIKSFITQHGIDTVYERFSDSLPNVAAEVLAWLYAEPGRLQSDAGQFYLLSANKTLDVYLHDHYDASEVNAYRRRKPEILRLLSADGRGAISHRLSSGVSKCVAVMPPGSSGAAMSAAKVEVPSAEQERF